MIAVTNIYWRITCFPYIFFLRGTKRTNNWLGQRFLNGLGYKARIINIENNKLRNYKFRFDLVNDQRAKIHHASQESCEFIQNRRKVLGMGLYVQNGHLMQKLFQFLRTLTIQAFHIRKCLILHTNLIIFSALQIYSPLVVIDRHVNLSTQLSNLVPWHHFCLLSSQTKVLGVF